jgi:hypothetical protein
VPAECQRQRAADYDEQLQHAPIVAGVDAKINGDKFWRKSPPHGFIASDLEPLHKVVRRLRAPDRHQHFVCEAGPWASGAIGT